MIYSLDDLGGWREVYLREGHVIGYIETTSLSPSPNVEAESYSITQAQQLSYASFHARSLY